MRRIEKNLKFRIWGLGLAVIAMGIASIIGSSCASDSKTNFCEKFHLRCKDGQECAANQSVCINIGGCGNNHLDPNEVCDDGNIMDGDGCSSDCTSDETCGNSTLDIIDPNNPKETCDHGKLNGASDDNCDTNCHFKIQFCGNGTVDKEEECDPGGAGSDSAGCNGNQAISMAGSARGTKLACKISVCGDGYVNKATEECDNGKDESGNFIINADCNGRLCTIPKCGDGFFNPSNQEECDTGDDTRACNGNNNGDTNSRCHIPRCGDSYINIRFIPPGSELPEVCDEGLDNSPTCNSNNRDLNGPGSCRVPSCGDGYFNEKFTPTDGGMPEHCDNGSADTPGCNGNITSDIAGHLNNPGAQCQIPQCGDNYINGAFSPTDAGVPEHCDNGSTDTSGCNGNRNTKVTDPGPLDGGHLNNQYAQCQPPQCGDGYINGAFAPNDAGVPEQCDNGSTDTANCNGNSPKDNTGHSNNLNAQCQPSQCGDGYTNRSANEDCDNLGGNDTASCNGGHGINGMGNCKIPTCGDGYINSNFHNEECDFGQSVTNNCPNTSTGRAQHCDPDTCHCVI